MLAGLLSRPDRGVSVREDPVPLESDLGDPGPPLVPCGERTAARLLRASSAAVARETGVGSRRRSLFFTLRPEIRRDYPLNLSILLSGGKETNEDSLSNGE